MTNNYHANENSQYKKQSNEINKDLPSETKMLMDIEWKYTYTKPIPTYTKNSTRGIERVKNIVF